MDLQEANTNAMDAKKYVGEKAAGYVSDGMIVGLGTGSTAYFATMKIGEMVRSGLQIKAVPTSKSTEQLALELNIPLIGIDEVDHINITIDGADEVDVNKQMIKGGGGALLREKIVASITNHYVIIVDDRKKVDVLGKFPVPVEVTPFAFRLTQRKLMKLGCTATIRLDASGNVFITDNGNYILDCDFVKILDPVALTANLNMIPGVVENGLFVNMANTIISSDIEGNIVVVE